MKVLIAPDKFKGSLSAREVCEAVQTGLHRHDPSHIITKIPLADGGEGTLDILDEYLKLQTITLQVNDPLFRPVTASYKIAGEVAYIEMAQASGLDLLTSSERNCLHTSSLGTGELIYHAYEQGARIFYLFIGGSATSEAGLGVLHALGIRAMHGNQTLKPVGQSLADITHLDTSGLYLDPQQLRFVVVCDVRNPLYGPQGAARVYGPQKGADAAGVERLDQGLRNFAQVVQQQQGLPIHEFEGSGAAGGIAAGIKGFFPTKIQRGIDSIMELVGLPKAMAEADLVITGEGKMDHQTLEGKVISGVHELCTRMNKDLGVICGTLSLTPLQLESMNFCNVQSLVRGDTDLTTAMQQARQLVSERAYEMLQEIL